ncbi:hypothetical protein JOD69_000081 [Methylocaldum sp. RMAD-M]|jgi:hypothetical protein|nr:hypothetical protein [Methylocaldum sp. RMAD-M]
MWIGEGDMTFLNGLFAEVEDVGLASGFGVVAAGAAGDFRCGSRPAGELLLQTPSMGFALWARLRRSKLAPGEFVFACPKTNLSGTNLDARSAPEGFAPGQAQIQSNQKKRRPSGMLFLRFSLWRWGDRRSFPAPLSPRVFLTRPFGHSSAKACDARACRTGQK